MEEKKIKINVNDSNGKEPQEERGENKEASVDGSNKGREDNDKEQGNGEIAIEDMSKEELVEKIKALEQKAEENFDRFVRCQAEMENYKKRLQKEKRELIKFSNESLIKELLGVIDNLEKAIQSTKENSSLEVLQQGVELTLKGLQDILKKAGLEPIEAEGKPFDPNFHEAVSETTDESLEHGIVQKELQKGYLLNGRLIRPAMVVVNRRK